jgi:hypothetical protein
MVEKTCIAGTEKDGLDKTNEQPEGNRPVSAQHSDYHCHHDHDDVFIHSEVKFMVIWRVLFHGKFIGIVG